MRYINFHWHWHLLVVRLEQWSHNFDIILYRCCCVPPYITACSCVVCVCVWLAQASTCNRYLNYFLLLCLSHFYLRSPLFFFHTNPLHAAFRSSYVIPMLPYSLPELDMDWIYPWTGLDWIHEFMDWIEFCQKKMDPYPTLQSPSTIFRRYSLQSIATPCIRRVKWRLWSGHNITSPQDNLVQAIMQKSSKITRHS